MAQVLYEYPFHEGVRTMLRLEHLFQRLALLSAREDAVDHHFALATIFEVMDVASRADLKSDLLKELDRQRSQLQSFRGHPGVSETQLEGAISRVERAFAELNQSQGKAGQALASNEWLMAVRSRINIPGGTCSFDLPAYHAWQQQPPAARQEALAGWIATLAPMAQALRVLLSLLRESGHAQRMLASGGQYQQSLPPGRTYQLLRVGVDETAGVVPELAGHRLMVSIRFMRADGEGRMRAAGADVAFDLVLCG